MDKTYYLTAPSNFGDFAIIWKQIDDQPCILRVVLPGMFPDMMTSLQKEYLHIEEGKHQELIALVRDIGSYLAGEKLRFDLRYLAWEKCTDFQIRVLHAEYEIPRGWVSTYGRIANKLGLPGGSRAVGRALATNPFPLLIPCHRAVRSTGSLGGYQGGLEMKKALLEMEGVIFSSPNRVSLVKVYY
jgi:methylated-DNA-[protein]-cysteine S-methyltransferase